MDLTLLGALDNAYVRAVVFYGLILLALYIYGVVKMFMLKDYSKQSELLCMITMTAYGPMESHIFIVNCNFTLLILAKVLYNKRVIDLDNLIKFKGISIN